MEAFEEGILLAKVLIVGKGTREVQHNCLRMQKRAGHKHLLIVEWQVEKRPADMRPDLGSETVRDTLAHHELQIGCRQRVTLFYSIKPLLPLLCFLGFPESVLSLEPSDDERLKVVPKAICVIGQFLRLFWPHYHNNFPSGSTIGVQPCIVYTLKTP